jgi:type I restriction enzyme, S subunit
MRNHGLDGLKDCTEGMEGYKRSEVGVIPVDWEVKRLGEIGIVSSGGTPNRSNLSYWNGNIPWITTSQIDFNTIISSNEFITELGLKNSAAKMYLRNTLLMAMYGQGKTRGKVAILGINATINQACAAIILNQDISNNCVFCYLAHNYEEIRKLSNTGNQENLNGNIIKSINVPLPPLAEQKTIALTLSDTDALIAACDRAITKKRNIKQGAMQQLLTGKMRLPSFSGEWEMKKLGEIADIKTGPFGSSLHEKDYVKDGIPIITVEHLGERGVLHESLPMVSEKDKKRLNSYIIQTGDIVFSRVGSVDRNSLISYRENGWLFSSRLLRIRITNQNTYSTYLSYYFHQEPTKQKIRSVAVGQTMASLNTQILKNIEVILPPLPEQKAIAQILSDMDAEIAALEKKRDKYKAIKQGMMQELLTGKTRLNAD